MKRAIAAAVIATLAALAVHISPVASWLDGNSVDVLLRARATLGLESMPENTPESPPAVVIAIDEETYRRPPFAGTPKATWPRYLGEVYQGVLGAGALVIGQDVVLPTSLEPLVPGIDRPYLAALARYGRAEGRIVLGATRHQGDVIGPHRSHMLVVGGQKNVRLLNLLTDPDGVARRAPLNLGAPDAVPGFAAELAARAGWQPQAGTPYINLRQDPNAAPVYSLADVLACVRAGDATFLETAFKDRVVLVGAVLDIEDRKSTSARYLGRVDSDHFAPRCHHEPMRALYADTVARTSIPGVLVHAQIVNDLLLNDELVTAPASVVSGGVWLLCLIAALGGILLRPFGALMALDGAVVAGIVVSLVALMGNTLLPVLSMLVATGMAGALAYVYRFVIADKDKRLIRQSFSKYLSPAVVDEMVASGKIPEPGGEAREVTIWFSDLAGFTKMSEGMTPEELVSALNEYLTVMTHIITSHRGMVDKYIGDAVVGIFGAPLDDPDNAANAIAAALACQDALDKFQAARPGWSSTRIGLHTGRAVVGNIGSDIRLDYTVMGDAVNLAARLESLNKRYGLTLLASEDTVNAAGNAACDDTLRRIDRVQVVGRSAPTTVYGLRGGLSSAETAAYDAALAALAAGDFAAAQAGFSNLAEVDEAAKRMVGYIAEVAKCDGSAWPGYFVLDKK
ncbi:MAG: CHASE2 domain-containing protein [Pikeienuella sp.]